MAEYITNCKIKKVYTGKTGTSEYGDWKQWNFYIEGHQGKKFSYFSSGEKPIPIEGRMLKILEYEIKQSDCGQYTNHNVSQLVYYPRSNMVFGGMSDEPPHPGLEAGPPYPADTPQGPEKHLPPKKNEYDSTITMYISYAKDIMCAIIERDGLPESLPTPISVAEEIISIGKAMYDNVHSKAPV